MKKILLPLFISCSVGLGIAQSDIIGVSGGQQNKIDFKDFRFIELQKGTNQIIAEKNAEIPDQVVGMTYDAKNQKLIFVGMHAPDIYSYDLANSNFQRLYTAGTAFSQCDLKEQFSRMATASNGISYALNNSSSQLIEVKPTPNGYQVKELGSLKSETNLDAYKYYGGDLIANDRGEIFLISAGRQIVRINPITLEATHLGEITGIDKKFTTNGSAVMSDGNVLLSNAQGKGYYVLDFDSMKAKPYASELTTPIYDLASPYLLASDKLNSSMASGISIYPSKIKDRELKVSLSKVLKGEGWVILYDLSGNALMKNRIDLSQKDVEHSYKLNHINIGNYYVKITDDHGNELDNEKIILIR